MFYIIHICLQCFAVTAKEGNGCSQLKWQAVQKVIISDVSFHTSETRNSFVYIRTQQILNSKNLIHTFLTFFPKPLCAVLHSLTSKLMLHYNNATCNLLFLLYCYIEVKQHLNIWRNSSQHFNHPPWHLYDFWEIIQHSLLTSSQCAAIKRLYLLDHVLRSYILQVVERHTRGAKVLCHLSYQNIPIIVKKVIILMSNVCQIPPLFYILVNCTPGL